MSKGAGGVCDVNRGGDMTIKWMERVGTTVARETATVRARVSVLIGLLLAGVALAQSAVLFAQTLPAAHSNASYPTLPESMKATSSRAAQENAVQSIPLDKLHPAARAKVLAVLSNVSIFRRMPVEVMPCDPELYLFLLEHPDVVVNIWQALGISRVSLKQTGPDTFQLTDEAGTVGSIQVLYRDQNTQVVLTEGHYNGPVFGRQLQGRILLVLKSAYIYRPDGRCYITTRLDSFTQIENIGLEILTKTIQPLVGKTADLNFLQTVNFVASLSRTAEVNQHGLCRLAKRLPDVQPEVRDQFAQVVERINEKAVARLTPEESPPALAEQPPETIMR
jgi:hypothetical protein